MKSIPLSLLFILINCTVFSHAQEMTPQQRIDREEIEWCDIWIPSVLKSDKPRVLLIGDSITKGYYKPVCTLLKETAYCARLTTSACIADPVFQLQLETLFNQYQYDVIHLNNGLHGIGYTEKEYRDGFENTLKYLQKQAPSANIIIALSTPLQSTSKKKALNPRIQERNRIVQELGAQYGAKINDLHAISKDHPEYYKDPYHFYPVAIQLQSQQVAAIIQEGLKGDKEVFPSSSQDLEGRK